MSIGPEVERRSTSRRLRSDAARIEALERTPVRRTQHYIIDGGGEELLPGEYGDPQWHVDGTIVSWSLLADQSGDINIDVWKAAYANYPPTNLDSITGGDDMFISGDDHNTDVPTSNWSPHFTRGDTIRFNVESVSDFTRVTINLELVTTVT